MREFPALSGLFLKEGSLTFKIFLDLDGVIFDFAGAVLARGVTRPDSSRLLQGFVDKSEWTKDELLYDEKIKALMLEKGFFRNLPLMPGAVELWRIAGTQSGSPIILTAKPKEIDHQDRVSKEKRLAVTDYFGVIPDDRFICCLRSEKKNYAVNRDSKDTPAFWGEPNILVDDLAWNCSEWEKAGGIAIQFHNNEQAVEDLKAVLNV